MNFLNKRNKYLLVSGIAIAVLLSSVYLFSDRLISTFVKNVLIEQAQLAFEQETHLTGLSANSRKGYISVEQLAFSNQDDSLRTKNFFAERVGFEAKFSGIFSPHVQVKNARADNVELLLEYIAPGVSNLKLVDQSFKNYLQQRRIQGKKYLLEWDLDYIELHNVRFRLVDYDGLQLVDVMIPRVALNSLSSSLSPEDNLAQILRQVQVSLIQEILKGRVTGEYDLKRVLLLVRRELPNSGLLPKESVDRMRDTGRSIMEKLFQ